jgi:spore germination cell wall hydrolase CwlJ-like protein
MTPVAQNSAKSSRTNRATKVTYNYTAKDRDCLKRAMYFESEHSDHDGYMAVGTVVMNRLTSGAYPNSICGIVAQEKQFAPGVMTRSVVDQAQPDLDSAADALLVRGERHQGVKDAMFFHTQGLSFPYDNMHYTVVAGGNAFYEKRDQNGMLETPAPLPSYEVAMNYVSDQAFALATNYVSPQPAATEAAPFLLPSAVPVPILTPPPTNANVSPEMTASINLQPTSISARLPAAIPTPEPAAAAIQAQLPTVVAVPSPRPPTMATTFAKVGG